MCQIKNVYCARHQLFRAHRVSISCPTGLERLQGPQISNSEPSFYWQLVPDTIVEWTIPSSNCLS